MPWFPSVLCRNLSGPDGKPSSGQNLPDLGAGHRLDLAGGAGIGRGGGIIIRLFRLGWRDVFRKGQLSFPAGRAFLIHGG